MTESMSPAAERSALRSLKIVGVVAVLAVALTGVIQNTGVVTFHILIWHFQISLILLLLLVTALGTVLGFALGRIFPSSRS